MTTFILTALAMIAFAANSVLARLALGGGGIDAAGYTGIRLASGALLLAAVVTLRNRRLVIAGSWSGASALFGYAIAFSLAYLMLDTGTGALVLFASVQLGMLAWSVFRGDRPGAFEWLGIVLALVSLAFLLSPGLSAPDPLGAALMVVAGLSWAAYSLIGRGSKAPLTDTAGNFVRCAPVAVALVVVSRVSGQPQPFPVACAIASGAIASGAGYAIWFLALPRLARSQASSVQLTVPAIAAILGVLLIGEAVTSRLVIASLGILGGVAVALRAADRRLRSTPR
jgi:drug/metabolite transporter (DMT)-like permease